MKLSQFLYQVKDCYALDFKPDSKGGDIIRVYNSLRCWVYPKVVYDGEYKDAIRYDQNIKDIYIDEVCEFKANGWFPYNLKSEDEILYDASNGLYEAISTSLSLAFNTPLKEGEVIDICQAESYTENKYKIYIKPIKI